MSQIGPSSSGQLAAAAVAFRRARRKFPKNLGVCTCSGDAARTPSHTYLAVIEDIVPVANNLIIESKPDYNPITDRSSGSNPQARGNHAWYPSLSSSRTVSWSNEYCSGQKGQIITRLNGITKPELVCAACSKKHSCVEATKSRAYDIPKDHEQGMKISDVVESSKTSTSMSRRVCSRIKTVESKESMNMGKLMISDRESHIEIASRSTHSSARKRRRHARNRRPCIHAVRSRATGSRSPPKIQGASHICHVHRYSATGRRSSIPRKPQNTNYYNQKVSTDRSSRLMEGQEKAYCSDSPTLADFPTKLQTWEHRTAQKSYGRVDNISRRNETIFTRQSLDLQKTCPKSRGQTMRGLHPHRNESSEPVIVENNQESNSTLDVCLRPSLIKAAQRKIEYQGRDRDKNYQGYRIGGCASKHSNVRSTWEENFNIINHKDSMSLLMERFRGNDKHQNLKLQNIYELNSVLGSKTSCGEGRPPELEKIHQTTDFATNQSVTQQFDDTESIESHFPPRKSFSGINPVTKLGRVANQALRENENRFKNLRARLNKAGIYSSPKGTPWRRAF